MAGALPRLSHQLCLREVDAYPNVKDGTDWLVVAAPQGHVAPVAQLRDILPSPQDPVTPGWRAAFLTAWEAKQGEERSFRPPDLAPSFLLLLCQEESTQRLWKQQTASAIP